MSISGSRKRMSRSLSVHESINGDNYEYAINLVENRLKNCF